MSRAKQNASAGRLLIAGAAVVSQMLSFDEDPVLGFAYSKVVTVIATISLMMIDLSGYLQLTLVLSDGTFL